MYSIKMCSLTLVHHSYLHIWLCFWEWKIIHTVLNGTWSSVLKSVQSINKNLNSCKSVAFGEHLGEKQTINLYIRVYFVNDFCFQLSIIFFNKKKLIIFSDQWPCTSIYNSTNKVALGILWKFFSFCLSFKDRMSTTE